MSAYVHDDSHINSLVCAVRAHELAPVTIDGIYCDVRQDNYADLVVRILKAKNIRSVNFRYNEEDPLYQGIKFEKDKGKKLSIYGLHMAISSLNYQSCETEDWRETFACRLLDAWTAEIEKRTGHTGDTIRKCREYNDESTWNIH